MSSVPVPLGQIITFYSYKGGTGRSMALANVACLLSRRQTADDGKPVLIIDWDLEAPGLHRYFEPFLRKSPSRPGLIDLLWDVHASIPPEVSNDSRDTVAQWLVDRIDLPRYVSPTRIDKLSFLKAGRFDAGYAERTNTFSWTGLYETLPTFFRLFAERLAREYSFVLVDSRTGVTDISGICTMLLPEKLVVVFTPNRQSLTGITELVARASAYRRASKDVRPLVAFPLPSRIDTSFPNLMKLWRMGDAVTIPGWQNEFAHLLESVYDLDEEEIETLEDYFDAVQMPHVAEYAFGEPIAVLTERSTDKLTVANSYGALRDYLLRGTPWTAAIRAERSAGLERKIAKLEERIRDSETEGPYTAAVPASANIHMPQPAQPSHGNRALAFVIASVLVLFGLFAAGYGIWSHYYDGPRTIARQLFSQVLQLGDQQAAPSTMALLLVEALPGLRSADHDLAMSRLGQIVGVMPPKLFAMTGADGFRGAAFSQSGTRILVNTKKSIAVVRVADGVKVSELPAAVEAVASYGDSDDEVIGYGSGKLSIWKGTKLTREVPFAALEGGVAFHCNGRYVSSLSGEYVLRIWSTDQLLQGGLEPPFRLDDTVALYFSSDCKSALLWRASVSGPSGPEIYGVPDMKPGFQVQEKYWVHGNFTSDFRVVAFCTNDRVDVLPVDGRRRVTIPVRAAKVALSPRGDLVAAIQYDGTIGTWDISTGRSVTKKAPKDFSGSPTAISGGIGRWTVFFEDEVMIFGTELETPVARIEVEGADDQRTSYGSATRLAVIGSDGVSLWDVDVARAKVDPAVLSSEAALRKLACERVGRNLTPEEWAIYVPNRDYAPACAALTPASAK